MKHSEWLFLLLLPFAGMAQNNPPDIKLPQILPASPEAAAITKAGQLSVGLHTGAATASIPIYTIKLGAVSLPIELSYSSNGTKVDEIPSRVGLNWTISAGGVITRVVHGMPDDQITRLQPPADLNANTLAVLNYLKQISGGEGSFNNDSDPDEFRFNAPGIGGKFICDYNWNAIQIPYSNVKIQVLQNAQTGITEILITGTDGVRYRFGGEGATETTNNHNLVGGIHSKQYIKTSFFLKKIEYPNGEFIQLNYLPVSILTQPGVSQSATRNTGGGSTCPTNTVAVNQPTISRVDYQSVYLNNITTSSGLSLNFFYQNRPDGSGDKRLTNVTVINNVGTTIRQVALGYLDPSAQGGTLLNHRYFLKEVKERPAGDSTDANALVTKLDYDQPEALPGRLSYGQDHFGFYNGAVNPGLLTLPPGEPAAGWGPNLNNDREPHGSFAMKGMLKRITYTTGGFDEYSYEPNTITRFEQVSTSTTASASGSGSGNNTAQTYLSGLIKVKRNHTARLFFSAFQNPSANNPAAPDSLQKIAEVKILNGLTVISTQSLFYYTEKGVDISLLAGNEYTIQLKVWSQSHAATATIRYDSAATDIYTWVNKEAGGVRVKQITSYDPLSNKATNRHYKYAFKDSLNRSSGLGFYQAQYLSTGTNAVFNAHIGGGNFNGGYDYCQYKVLSSNTVMPLSFYENNHIGYRAIVESDDAEFKNGCTEHLFVTQATPHNGQIVRGEMMPGIPTPTYVVWNGLENQTRVYNANGSLQKSVRHYHDIDPRINIQFEAIAARSRYAYTDLNGAVNDEDFQPFDVSKYLYQSTWIKIDSTITTDYDPATGEPQVSKSVYYYDDINNIQPHRIVTTGTDGQQLTVEKKFPTDLAAPGNVYEKMVAANIISPAVEELSRRGTSQLVRTKTEYKDWLNDGRVIEPETISTQKGNGPSEIRLRNKAFDNDGNLLEVEKENDLAISYIWDYANNFPIAEVKNAHYNEIAYTSFEAGGKGGWAFTGTIQNDATSPGGSKAYSLNTGSITRSGLNPATTYIISYWSRGGPVTINGSQQKLVLSENGWTCYEHTVTGTANITISGSATIDELRLHPKGAFMTTYGYIPFFGISHTCTPNHIFTFYEYDGLGRLKNLRDNNRRIIKQPEYKYGQPVTPCTGNAANWQNTGEKRCVKTSGYTNNYTSELEREQRDMNNCSPTYLQTRWVNMGNTGACPPVPNCAGTDRRVVNGVCEAGQKIIVNSTLISPNRWECVCYYKWSDGFNSPALIETSNTGCMTEQ